MQRTDDIHNLFLSCIYNNVVKRTKKHIDMFALNEITNLPLIFCEKLCWSVSPVNGVLSSHLFKTVIKKLLFCNEFSTRLSFITEICDFKHKKTIQKSNIKLLLTHLNNAIMTYKTLNLLYQIIDSFFGDKKEISTSSFYEKCKNKNRDLAYIFFVLLDKFSFGDHYEQLQLFNSEIFNGSKKIEKYLIQEYDLALVSQSAIDYGQKLIHSAVIKGPNNWFEEENNDEMLLELDNFENDITGTLENFGNPSTQFSTRNICCWESSKREEEQEEEKNNDFLLTLTEGKTLEKTERINKTFNLLMFKSKNFTHLSNLSTTCCTTKRFLSKKQMSTKRLFDNPLNNSKYKNSSNSFSNEIICYKQSQKYKKLIKIKLVQIDSLIFYFKCYNEDKIDELNSQFTLTKIILAKYLFPQVIKYPTIKDFYQLQLTSCLQNTQSVINLYSKNEKRLIAFKKKLFHSQGLHSRGIRDIYKFGREIGKGKFGTIYKGTHIASLRTIAIKEVSKYETGKSNVYTSVKWEKEIFKFLSNSECEAYNIIKCYEYIETPNYIYYIMEYVKNGDLKTYLNDTPKISENIINSICKQMLSALSFLHSNGIIHRDIKLTNTMITKYNSSISVKIIDFGLSRIIAHDDFIYENFGTLIFKAPEIMIGNNYNFSVDLWSFGMTIFYLMFRRFPVEEKDRALYKKKILNENFMDIFIQKGITYAEYATKVIFQCLVKEPSKRKSACELLQ